MILRTHILQRASQNDLLNVSLIKDESQGLNTATVSTQAITTEQISSSDRAGEDLDETVPQNTDCEADTEATLTSESAGEFDTGCSAATDPNQPPSLIPVGEPFTKYIVGFGRNPFGRFSLTAALNEKTGDVET